MSVTWKSWLPESAIGDTADRMLDDMLRQWSEKWFAGQFVCRLAPLTPSGAEDREASGATHYLLDGNLAVSIAEPQRTAIAVLMLDAPDDLDELTPTDRQILDRLATSCIEDFRARVAKMFRLPKDGRWSAVQAESLGLNRPYSCPVGVSSGGPLTRIFVEKDALARLRKISLPPIAERTELQPIVAGLAEQAVSISAFLGRCSLTVSDLRQLSEGDVLVLDRELTGRLDVAVDGQIKPAQCVIEQEGTQLRIKITKPFFG